MMKMREDISVCSQRNVAAFVSLEGGGTLLVLDSVLLNSLEIELSFWFCTDV